MAWKSGILWLCTSLGLLTGLWGHDLLARTMARHLLAASAYKEEGLAMVPPRPGRVAQYTDKGLLDTAGFVPRPPQLEWLRVELDTTVLGVGVGLPEEFRGTYDFTGVDLTNKGRSRWFDHGVMAASAGAVLVVSLTLGSLLASGRGARLQTCRRTLESLVASRVCSMIVLAALIPPVLFYLGYNRLHLGSYGLGSFTPPAWAIWPAMVFAGVLAGWAWTRRSIEAINIAWERTACPARCPPCGYAWDRQACSECGSQWTPEVLRRSRSRTVSRVVVGLTMVAAVALAAPQLSPLVLASGPASAKAQFLVRWLAMRPTNYSVGEGWFLPGAW